MNYIILSYFIEIKTQSGIFGLCPDTSSHDIFLFFRFSSFRKNMDMFKDLSLGHRDLHIPNCAPIQCTVWHHDAFQPTSLATRFLFESIRVVQGQIISQPAQV